ncbi:MAG: hypothetical protein Q9209_000196 [Squamulea sp. 1 TL-2023]
MNLTVNDAVLEPEPAMKVPDKASHTIGGPLASLALLEGAREPVSKSPFLTTGVTAEQTGEAEVVEVATAGATTVVRTVVAGGAAVRMQEHALLSLVGGYVVTAKTARFAFGVATVVLQRCQECLGPRGQLFEYVRDGGRGLDCWSDIGATESTGGRAVSGINE